MWTNDSTENEHYVIDVVQGKVVNTITGVSRASMLSVQNWERVHEAMQKEELVKEMKAMQEQVVANAMEGIKKDNNNNNQQVSNANNDILFYR